MTEASVNIDSLTGQKIDTKVVGIIFSEICILKDIEIMADKTKLDEIEKMYLLKQRKPGAAV